MVGRADTSALLGIEGQRVIVEADYSDGLPSFDMVGLLDGSVREARERVRSALKNSGIAAPPGKLVVNLSPADVRKQGNHFDLPVAVAIMVSLGIIPQAYTERFSFIGELALNGELRATNGTLSHVLCARNLKKEACILPAENAQEGAVISGVSVYGFHHLSEVMDFLLKLRDDQPEVRREYDEKRYSMDEPDFSEIIGQKNVRRAAEVASAGMHGLLLIGPPGSGKTLTARRIPSILPPLTEEEQIETSKIHSVAGILNREQGLIHVRPFRSPHHTVSANALAGGGVIPRPGEMSLAHNGVLFLDELPEFSKQTLEVMRQPLEDRQVVISRVHGSYVFPTRVMLVCAMNPCRCGYFPDRNKCHCSERDIRQYLSRISRPLLDRIDITAEAARVPAEQLTDTIPAESSAIIRERVLRAWNIQKERYKGQGIVFNSQLQGKAIRKYCVLGRKEQEILKDVFDKMDLSVRAHDRILKVARTIADLEEEEMIRPEHIYEAVSYRETDRKFWGGEL